MLGCGVSWKHPANHYRKQDIAQMDVCSDQAEFLFSFYNKSNQEKKCMKAGITLIACSWNVILEGPQMFWNILLLELLKEIPVGWIDDNT